MEEVQMLQDLVHLCLTKGLQLLLLVSLSLVSPQARTQSPYGHKEIFSNWNIPILNSQLFLTRHQRVMLVYQDYYQNTESFLG